MVHAPELGRRAHQVVGEGRTVAETTAEVPSPLEDIDAAAWWTGSYEAEEEESLMVPQAVRPITSGRTVSQGVSLPASMAEAERRTVVLDCPPVSHTKLPMPEVSFASGTDPVVATPPVDLMEEESRRPAEHAATAETPRPSMIAATPTPGLANAALLPANLADAERRTVASDNLTRHFSLAVHAQDQPQEPSMSKEPSVEEPARRKELV